MARKKKEEQTEAQVNEQTEALTAKKAQRKQAKVRIREFVKTLVEGEQPLIEAIPQLKSDLILIVGTGLRGRGAVPSMAVKIKEALIEAAEIGLTEMQLFAEFKVGRPEMARNVKLFLKAKPDERIWVKFDKETENYQVIGVGVAVPAEWDGYIPADVEQL